MDKCLVYLPVYNGEKYIRETIDSVLAQDYGNFQIVIYDDCSKDSSEQIIEAYIKENPGKIIYHKNAFNLGVGTTLRKCYEAHHNARYFAQIGHDDIWPKNYLSSQIAALEKTKAVVTFADNDYVNSDGSECRGLNIFSHELISKLNKEEFFLHLLERNFLCAPASVVDISKFDPEEGASFWGYNNDRLQDCELWLNLSLRGRFCFNRNVKMHYRVHSTNLSDESKRVMQGRMEYYTMVHRIVYSGAFSEFLDSLDDPERFADALLDTLAKNIAYSNPIKLLIINLCEHFLNSGYNSEKIWMYLEWLYMDTGIITKCLKNGRKLTAPIELVFGGSIRAKGTVKALEQCGNFTVREDMNTITPHSMCVTQKENMEFLMNWAPFYYNYLHGQVLMFCKRGDLDEQKRRYSHLLVLPDDISVEGLEKELYQFIEDRTHIYRNGFFDMLTGYGYPDRGYSRILVELEDTSAVRAVDFIDREHDGLVLSSGGEMLTRIESDQAKCLFEANTVRDGRLTIEAKDGIGLKERIVVNNELYICADVEMMPSNDIVPIFKAASYSNSSCSTMIPSAGEMLGQCNQLARELERVTGSFAYVTAMKFVRLLTALGIAEPVKKMMKSVYRVIFRRPYGAE